MILPTMQTVFKVFGDDYDTLGEMFEGLSVDDVLDGMEGTQSFVSIRKVGSSDSIEFPIGFDTTRNSIALLDDKVGTECLCAEDLLKDFALGNLKCDPSNCAKDDFIAIYDGMNGVFNYWA